MSENATLKVSVFGPWGSLHCEQTKQVPDDVQVEFVLGQIPSGYLVVVENVGSLHFAGYIFGAYSLGESSWCPVGTRVTLLGRTDHCALFGSRGGTLEYSVFARGQGFSIMGGGTSGANGMLVRRPSSSFSWRFPRFGK